MVGLAFDLNGSKSIKLKSLVWKLVSAQSFQPTPWIHWRDSAQRLEGMLGIPVPIFKTIEKPGTLLLHVTYKYLKYSLKFAKFMSTEVLRGNFLNTQIIYKHHVVFKMFQNVQKITDPSISLQASA